MKATTTTTNNGANFAIYLSVFFLISLVTIFCYFNPSLLK